jgi:hypothetical protein
LDYIIFGIGSGATLVLVGWLLRDWGPRLRDRVPADETVLSASEMVVRMAWARFCATCGMSLVLCGIPILVVTAIAALMSASDDRGAMAVLGAYGLAIVLMLVWTALYLRQFGSLGVHRPGIKVEKPKKAPAAKPAPVVGPVLESPTAAPVAAAALEPSFDDAAAAPGGLGRFAAFMRKDAPAVPAEPDTTPAEAPVPVAADELAADDAASTDAVIAELAGVAETDTEKRLSLSDPLVSAVLGESADQLEEAWDDVASANGVPAEDDSKVTQGSDSGDEEDSAEPTREAALDSLRRRRIERLARDSSSG